MAIQFERTSPGQLPELSSFLNRVLQGRAGERYRQWKYWESVEVPGWQESRSFVLRRDGEIIAHCCAIPLSIRTPEGERIRGLHSVDWAASAPGAGLQIWRQMYPLTDVFFGMNGSEPTRKLLAGLRQFRELTRQRVYRRVIRPWSLFTDRVGQRGLKEALRLGRNAIQALAPLAAIPAGWKLCRVDRFGDETIPLFRSSPECLIVEKPPALLNYFLRCPVGRMQGWILEEKGTVRGYLLTNQLEDEFRIVDFLTDRVDATDWATLIALGIREALAGGESRFLSATSACGPAQQALERNAFRYVGDGPVCVHDPKNLLAGSRSVHIQSLDGDEAYL